MNKKAFTLVELLAVIVILGVIFMFVVPRLSTLIKNGEIKQREVLETKIINASKEYVSSYNRSLYDNLVEVGDYNYVCLNNLLDNKLLEESDLNGLDEISGIRFELEENNKVDYIIEYGDSSVCDNTLINLTVELNGGRLSNNVEGSYSKGSTIELGVPTKEGATFNKWVVTKGSGEIEGNTLKMHYTDVTVYALYKSLATLTVDKNGGSSSQEFEENYPTGTIIELEDLTKTGYVFTGWEVVNGNSILSGKRITIGSTDTTIKGIFTLGSYTCSAGKYLKSGEASCSTCETGSYCPGGTYQYNPNEDQGISGCPGGIDSPAGSSLVTQCEITCEAGTYLKKGETSCSVCEAGSYCTGGTYNYSENIDQGINKCSAGTYSTENASSCIACVTGSYSDTNGATSCTACQNGKTTNGDGQTSCNANCSNTSNVSTWEPSVWNNANTVNSCVIATCVTGKNDYTLQNSSCVFEAQNIYRNGTAYRGIGNAVENKPGSGYCENNSPNGCNSGGKIVRFDSTRIYMQTPNSYSFAMLNMEIDFTEWKKVIVDYSSSSVSAPGGCIRTGIVINNTTSKNRIDYSFDSRNYIGESDAALAYGSKVTCNSETITGSGSFTANVSNITGKHNLIIFLPYSIGGTSNSIRISRIYLTK